MSCILRNEEGQAMPIVAFMLILLIGMCSLVIDVGALYIQKSEAQTAVDAAALAGAQTLNADPVNTAKQYAVKNGLDESKVNVKVKDDSVTVTATKEVKYSIMPLFGIKSDDLIVTATARAKKESPVYDYVLFTGDPNYHLAVSGYQETRGDTHINGSATVSGSHRFYGKFEVVNNFTESGYNIYNELILNAAHIPMPNFDIDYYKKNANKIYKTSQSFNNLNINGIIFVDGDVNVAGSSKGIGTIVATGTINLSGYSKYTSGSDFISFYGQRGINVSGSSFIDGFLYAPQGQINLSGYSEIFGAVIAKSISISGSHRFTYDQRVSNSQKTSVVLIK